jgi:DNA-binding MarR family transcriptional regulator
MKKQKSANKRTKLMLSIVRTSDILNRYLQIELAKHGSSPQRFAIMNALFLHGDKMTPTAISKWVFRAKHSTTNMLKVLEGSGVIRRVPNRNDGRSVNIVVTSKGLKGRPKMLSAAEQISDEALSCFDDKELITLMNLLKEFRRHLLKKIYDSPRDDVNK